MKNKKLLAILGSPHQTGETAAMLECAIQEAKRKGWSVDRVNLYEKNLAFCNGCRTCIRTGACIQKDDIVELSQLLKNCDMVVLAAPTYWANVPAIVKNMFDRLLGTVMEETEKFPKPRLSAKQRYVLLTACNTPYPFSFLCGQSSGAIRSMKEFFKTAGMKYAGKFVLSNTKKNFELSKRAKQKISRYFM
ncbi:flavodoxin family protein [Extibacter muris]|uniref:flavodoxin family protein n=1 Tax=Extibacter muris TaxID=1796622 RepID=UPI001D082EC3|nr:flavodoxin family protein [Extibacter muris]MCB6203114.1 flavodoxin family protein [Extibacter muris]MCQ4664339.1 flavodoxin family protein [Extibacter muris]MCQ4692323.1 flavodoxin family protein [Extibacter muris]MCQ4692432.1 flavodoxin family protein [Extibacter muris]